MSVSRRQFLCRGAIAAGAVSLPMFATQKVFGANDKIRIGTIGLGVRGAGSHVPGLGSQKGVEIAAVCDPDQTRLDACVKKVQDKFGNKPAAYADMRKLIERKDLDAVSVATMQYWHALPTIWACQAGKHVYCEKPLSHFIWEGQQMVKAARKYNRLVQVGTQSRSNKAVPAGIEYLKSGALGKIQRVYCFANKPRTSIGLRKEPLPIPKTLDYELWCGPAKKEPIYRDRIQYDCSFTWNMGDGESCNQGVHEIDVARWVLGEDKPPRRVMSIGGRFCFNDAGDVPNAQIIYYDFPSVPVIYIVHNLRKAKGSKETPSFRGVRTDVCAECDGGYLMVRSGRAYDKKGKLIEEFPTGDYHFANFIAALRSGRREDLNADVLEGHRSTTVTHLGNISLRLGEKATPEAMRKQTADTPAFAKEVDNLLAHLKANGVQTEKKTVTLGPWLEVDRENECFKNNDDANRLVRGTYRAPWLITEV
ncbi:MAG: Gfo/Idh/MocA family oxidoreductase [Pirellulales bacterium]|nr:Gfo/Idh/MocA family oxidoreductase [Pirellulales bacterium]